MKKPVKIQGTLLLTIAVATTLLLSRTGFTRPGDTGPGNDSAALANSTKTEAEVLYNRSGLGPAGLSLEVFAKAMRGYQKMKVQGLIRKPLLTIADMSKPSGQKRLYIIDMENGKLLKHTLVAHGRNSGDVIAKQFSNTPSSLQSSLGFFLTSDTYQGNNGYSLRLAGLEKGINDKALERAIVMHGASYVNEQIAASGRIGRSWGCPAVSVKEHQEIINTIKGGSCLFIYAPQPTYLSHSTYLRNDTTI